MAAWYGAQRYWCGPDGVNVPGDNIEPEPTAYPIFGSSLKAPANSQAWADKFTNETQPAYGGLSAVRTFNPGDIGNWTSGNVGHIMSTTPPEFAICHSYKTYSLPAFIAWATNKPDDGRLVWVSYHHEPENDYTLNTQAYRDWSALWNQRQRDLSDALRSIGRTDIKLVGILMSWTLRPASGRVFSDWHPGTRTSDGTHYWDEIWWDPYNGGFPNYYADPWAIVQGVKDASDSINLPFGIGEFGTGVIASDTDGSGRAAWIDGYCAACVDLGATGVLYWDSQVGDDGTYHVILDDPVALAAIRPYMTASRAAHGVVYP